MSWKIGAPSLKKFRPKRARNDKSETKGPTGFRFVVDVCWTIHKRLLTYCSSRGIMRLRRF
jgi:hypothetical protein